MPARVEFRLGSIFDEPCDLLVIPSFAEGIFVSEIGEEVRRLGLPFPAALEFGSLMFGSIVWGRSPVPRYRFVAYAAVDSGQASESDAVYQIGRAVGKVAFGRQLTRIVTPILGVDSGDLPDRLAVEALSRGFLETAPDESVLRINVPRSEVYDALTGKTSRVERTNRDLLRERLKIAPTTPDPVTPASIGSTPAVTAPVDSATRSARTGVFISYSHEDAEWLARLQKHLKPLQREGTEVWDDTRLKAGEQWREEIREALAAAKVAILLVSPDFLASEFIATDELPPLLKAAEEDGATILPVIVSHCRFDRTPSLSRFQAVNDPAKPLVRMGRGNRDRVLDQLARAVEDALKR